MVMHYLMYMIAAISISLVPVLKDNTSIIYAITAAALSVWVGLYFKRRRFNEEVQAIKAEKQKAENVKRMVDSAHIDTNLTNQENNEHQEIIGNIANVVNGILHLQLSLLSHIKNIEQNQFTIGYMFGLVDGLLQIRGIDIDDTISVEIMGLVLKSNFSNTQATEVLDIYAKEAKNEDSLVFQGLCAGGEDIFNQFKQNTPPWGLLNYFDEMPNSPSNDKPTMEKRLEKLAALHKDGLITKKVFEQKQAEIVSEL